MTAARSVAQSVVKSVVVSAVKGAGGGVDLIGAGALGAWSLKSLKSVTAVARVRRDSDNSESDFLNSAGLLSFVGAGSGFATTVYDQSGNGKHFNQSTTTQQPRIVNSGVPDNCLVFDGINDSMSVGARVTSGSISALTVMARVNTTATSQKYLIGENNFSSWGWSMQLVNGAVRAVVSADATLTNYKSYQTTATVNNGAWRHVAFTFSANSLKLFIDGVEQTPVKNNDSTVNSIFNTTAVLVLGDFEQGSFALPGCFDDIRIYGRELSAAEILLIKNQQ